MTVDRGSVGALAALLEGGWRDVSRPLHDGTPVWPGDHPVRLHTERARWGVLSWIETTCHAGTHVDAPMHLDPAAAPLEAVSLERFLGRAEVVGVGSGKPLVGPADLPAGWQPRAPRLLLRSGSCPPGAGAADGYTALAPELVPWLAERGVELVGVDTPSVDPFDSEELPAHRALATAGLTWIENLLLEGVDDGLYLLIALPLPLVGVEASPVRALVKPLIL